MPNRHAVEYTDTFGGEANYSWVERATVVMPALTHYDYRSRGYAEANRRYERELMRRAKAAVGLTGRRGVTTWHGDTGEFRPCGMNTVLFITFVED